MYFPVDKFSTPPKKPKTKENKPCDCPPGCEPSTGSDSDPTGTDDFGPGPSMPSDAEPQAGSPPSLFGEPKGNQPEATLGDGGLQTGVEVATYQSQGMTRGIRLRYDSGPPTPARSRAWA